MRIMAIEGHRARCSARGVHREVDLFLLQDERPRVGDYVLVHVGCAIQKMAPAEARSVWELQDGLAAANRGDPPA